MKRSQERAERIYLSSGALRGRTVEGVVEEARRYGFEQLELTSSFAYYDGIRDEVIAARRGGRRLLLHNYFPPARQEYVLNLASENREIRTRSLEHCRAALTLSAEVGAPFFSVHAGFVLDPRPDELGVRLTASPRRDKIEAMWVFIESVGMLCETARREGVSLLIENNVLSQRNLVNGHNELLLGVTPDDFDDLFEALRCPELGMLLDVGHLKVSARTLGLDQGAAIARLSGYVRALHLSDNDGCTDDNQPFGADAWFLADLQRFGEAVFVIETRAVGPSALSACYRAIEDAP